MLNNFSFFDLGCLFSRSCFHMDDKLWPSKYYLHFSPCVNTYYLSLCFLHLHIFITCINARFPLYNLSFRACGCFAADWRPDRAHLFIVL